MKNSRFKRVLRVAELAKKLEAEDRVPMEEKKSQFIKEINAPVERRNYNLEAYEQILSEEEEQE